MSLVGYLALNDEEYVNATFCPDETMVKNCIDNNDGTATCKYMDTIDIKCSKENLKSSQYKN